MQCLLIYFNGNDFYSISLSSKISILHLEGFKLRTRFPVVEIVVVKNKINRYTHYAPVYSMWHGRFN